MSMAAGRRKAAAIGAATMMAALASHVARANLLGAQSLHVEALETEYQQNPIGIDARTPAVELADPRDKHIVVRPRPGGGLTYAKATLVTPYGDAAAGWRLEGDRLVVTAIVPPNKRGTVRPPGARLEHVREGGADVAAASGVRRTTQTGDTVVVEVGSGSYTFTYDAAALAATLRAPVKR